MEHRERIQAAYDLWRAETQHLGDYVAFEAGYRVAMEQVAHESALIAGYPERPDCPSAGRALECNR